MPPPASRRGPAGPNLAKDALGVGPQLRAKFQLRSPDGAGAYSEHTNILANIAKYIIDTDLTECLVKFELK